MFDSPLKNMLESSFDFIHSKYKLRDNVTPPCLHTTHRYPASSSKLRLNLLSFGEGQTIQNKISSFH